VYEFVDCSEGGADDDVFELLDRILASDGFVLVTP
jgi:multimeric flavodoxin WrbA